MLGRVCARLRPAVRAATPWGASPAPQAALSTSTAAAPDWGRVVAYVSRARAVRGGVSLAQLNTLLSNIQRGVPATGGSAGATDASGGLYGDASHPAVASGAARLLLQEATRLAVDSVRTQDADALTGLLQSLGALHALSGSPQLSACREAHTRHTLTGRRVWPSLPAGADGSGGPAADGAADPPAAPRLRPSELAPPAPPSPASLAGDSPERLAPLFHALVEAAAAHPRLHSLRPALLVSAAQVLAVDAGAPWHAAVFTLLDAARGEPPAAGELGHGRLLPLPPPAADALVAHPRLVATLLAHYSRLDTGRGRPDGGKLPASPELLARVGGTLTAAYRAVADAAHAGIAAPLHLPGVLDDGLPQLHALGRRLAVALGRQVLHVLLPPSSAPVGAAPPRVVGGSPPLALSHAVELLQALSALPRAAMGDGVVRPARRGGAAGSQPAPSDVPPAAAAAAAAATTSAVVCVETAAVDALVAALTDALRLTWPGGESGRAAAVVGDPSPVELAALLASCARLLEAAPTAEARSAANALHAATRAATGSGGLPTGGDVGAGAAPPPPATTGAAAAVHLLHAVVARLWREPSSPPPPLPLGAAVAILTELARAHLPRSWHVPGDADAAQALQAQLLAAPAAEWAGVTNGSLVGLLEALASLPSGRSAAGGRTADVACAVAMLLLRRGGVPPYGGPAAPQDPAQWFAAPDGAGGSTGAGAWADADVARCARAAATLAFRIGSSCDGGPGVDGAVAAWAAAAAAAPSAGGGSPAASSSAALQARLQAGEPAAGARLAAAGAPRALQALCFLRDVADAAAAALAGRWGGAPVEPPGPSATSEAVRMLATCATLAPTGAACGGAGGAPPSLALPLRAAHGIACALAAAYLRAHHRGAPSAGPAQPTLTVVAAAPIVTAARAGWGAVGPYSRRLPSVGGAPAVDPDVLGDLRTRLQPLGVWLSQPVALDARMVVGGALPPPPPAGRAPTAVLLHTQDRTAVVRLVCALLDAAACVLEAHAAELKAAGAALAAPGEGGTTAAAPAPLPPPPRWIAVFNRWVAAANRSVASGLQASLGMATPPGSGHSSLPRRGSPPAPADRRGAAMTGGKLVFDVDARGTEARLMRVITAAQAHNARLGGDPGGDASGWELLLPTQQVARLVEVWADWQPGAGQQQPSAQRA